MNDSNAARPRTGRTRRLTACWVACLALTSISTTVAAQDDDAVIFNNGDRLTGEIRGLARGYLSFNTDATGTIQIEWTEVAELHSKQSFEIYLISGQRYFGTFPAPEEPGELYVDAGGTEPFGLAFRRVVEMVPIESTFWERLDIDLDFGYDFTKSSDVEKVSLGFSTRYQGEEHLAEVRGRTIRTDRGVNGGLADQANLNVVYGKLLRDLWFASGVGGLESNSELGIDLRTTLGGGVGRILTQSGEHRIALLGGLIQTREEVVDSDETRDSVEGLANISIDWYRSDDSEFDISTRLTLYPSFSESGRYRSEFDLDLEWELIGDITWGLTFYHTFDSDPPSAGAVRADYGVITSFGMDF